MALMVWSFASLGVSVEAGFSRKGGFLLCVLRRGG